MNDSTTYERKAFVIIVMEGKWLHICEPSPADRWYPIDPMRDMFPQVENIFQLEGYAHNLTDISKKITNGQSIDYEVTANVII